jgi:mono/diheme cytochrome c family protein
VFRAARFDGDRKTEDARITVYQNGTLIHDDFPLPRKTGAGEKEGPEPRPIKLQGHHNPVKFRNVWIRKLDLDGAAKPAAMAPAKPAKKGYVQVIPFEDIPPAPALPPEAALGSFRLHEDFEMSLAAHEPAVQTPFAAAFDGDGRMWVVEQRGYMLDMNASGEDGPHGRVSILTDTDGDGFFDDHKVFMDGLNQPRSIAFYKNGLLYAGHDALEFIEIENDRPGARTVIDPDYAGKGNVEHRANGLLRALDNWIYNAKSDARYREIGGKWVKEKTDFRGQWGISQNNHGRLFYNENWFGMKADQLMPNLLRRNPNFPKPMGNAATLSYRDKLFPARVTPGVNRGGEGDLDENGHLKAATAACGPVVYRGDQFPPEFRDTAFFCEPAANLVRMLRVTESDGLLAGETPLVGREFLASTDERFRPVNLFTAPDGTLILVDLYHGIVQHKAYLTPYLKEHIARRNLESDPQLGRIYRIKHKADPPGATPRLRGKSAAELVPFLAHANGWWRDTAQQRIVDSGDSGAVPALKALAGDPGNPLGRIHALWTLEGLGALDAEVIAAALEAKDPFVVESAIRLAELLSPGEAESLLPIIQSLANGPEVVVVRRQLAASLGRLPGDDSLRLLKEILAKDIDRPFFREAAIHGLAGREQRFREIIGSDLDDAKLAAYLDECLRPKTTAAAFPPPRDKAHLASFARGEALYVKNCMACHGADGAGLELLGPPLAGSEWVTASPKRLAAILLQGMMGPIRVAGKDYDPPSVMPGLKQNPDLGDADLADIATFTRHAWGNGKDAVKAATVAEVRAELAGRDTVFTAGELEKAYP